MSDIPEPEMTYDEALKLLQDEADRVNRLGRARVIIAQHDHARQQQYLRADINKEIARHDAAIIAAEQREQIAAQNTGPSAADIQREQDLKMRALIDLARRGIHS